MKKFYCLFAAMMAFAALFTSCKSDDSDEPGTDVKVVATVSQSDLVEIGRASCRERV